MFRKNYFTFLLAIALFLVGGVAVFAQTAAVSGKVVLKKGDTTVPAEGALVEVFRIDSKTKGPTDKTGKKGDFAFAGLMLGYKYVLSVSGPGMSPNIQPVSPGDDKIVITVNEGDGKRFTQEEVRAALAGAKTTTNGDTTGTTNTTSTETEKPAELTEEEKKAKAEYEKKVAEVISKNQNSQQKNAIFQASLKEGGEAFAAKNYDLAIAKFDEGYKADTEFVGSAPAFLNNKGKSLALRAVEKFNKNNKLADPTAKMEAMNSVAKDFADAIDAFNTSWTILKTTTAASVPDPKNYEINKTEALNGVKNVVGYMIATERVDNSKTPVIKTLLTEYIAIETDAAKKSKAQTDLADIFRIAGDSDNAIIEYRKALEMSPDNPDALAGLGLSLFNSGEINNNVAQKQEGLGYMERFAEVAPDTHKLKASVADAVTYLKSQKIAPTKVTPKKKN
jgi:tetratricopeptide (TPR) repeat protein